MDCMRLPGRAPHGHGFCKQGVQGVVHGFEGSVPVMVNCTRTGEVVCTGARHWWHALQDRVQSATRHVVDGGNATAWQAGYHSQWWISLLGSGVGLEVAGFTMTSSPPVTPSTT